MALRGIFSYLVCSDLFRFVRDKADRDAWQDRARRLAVRLDAQQRQEAAAVGGGGPDRGECDPDAALARHLEALERTEAGAAASASSGGMESTPSTSGSAVSAVQPTAAQQRVMSGLLSRGRVGGWIVEPSEVRRGDEGGGEEGDAGYNARLVPCIGSGSGSEVRGRTAACIQRAGTELEFYVNLFG